MPPCTWSKEWCIDVRLGPPLLANLRGIHYAVQMTALVEMENSGLIALLRDDKYEDLARMYSLFRCVPVRVRFLLLLQPELNFMTFIDAQVLHVACRRVEQGLNTIRSMMAEHIKSEGKQLVLVSGLYLLY